MIKKILIALVIFSIGSAMLKNFEHAVQEAQEEERVHRSFLAMHGGDTLENEATWQQLKAIARELNN